MRYFDPTSEIYFMQRGDIGHGGPERAGPDEVNAAEVRLLIANALGQLSAEHRAVICRSYYLGWTTAQIADDLHIGEWFVKSTLHFALRALRLTLERHREVAHASRPPKLRFRRHVPHASRR
jgi:DNA-directed RNA polymerase specialized sigma24 family protein